MELHKPSFLNFSAPKRTTTEASFMGEFPSSLAPRETAPLKNKGEDPFAKTNEHLQTNNGAGGMLYKFASKDALSESGEPINRVSRVLVNHGGEAPIPTLIAETGLPEEEILGVTNLRSMFDVVKTEGDEPDLLKSEPLIEFLSELEAKEIDQETEERLDNERIINGPKSTVIFEASKENK